MLHYMTLYLLFCDITQFQWSINSKPRIERLSECGVDSVNEGHCVRDAVEGQSSCTVIHIHSYSRGDGDLRKLSLCVVVTEWVFAVTGRKAIQTPGLIIISKCTFITPSHPADALIWHWYTHSSPTPLNLPVTASKHTLSTQHLSQTIKSVWMIRIWLVRVSFSNHSVLLSQTEVFMHCDFIQCEPTEIWKR